MTQESITTKEYMQSYCSQDRYRPAMEKLAKQGGYIYATDGHRAIRIPEIEADFEVEPNPEYQNIEAAWRETSRPSNTTVGIAFLKYAIEEIPLTSEKIECSECEGEGKVDCHCCGHTNGCNECDGDGYICNPHKQVKDFENYSFRIGGIGFNSRFVSEVVRGMELENVEVLTIDHCSPEGGNIWCFGKYEVLIMPMILQNEDPEYIIDVEVTRP